MVRINVSMPKELLDKLDSERGYEARSRAIRKCVEYCASTKGVIASFVGNTNGPAQE